jgi:hypothetical protein
MTDHDEPTPDTAQDFADWANGPEVTSSPLVEEVQRLRRELEGAVEAERERVVTMLETMAEGASMSVARVALRKAARNVRQGGQS